ncbi:MAG: reverse transcriptase-like protein [Lachnospiraceae bacterium]|nr:reverse transcriptase-like protein [Lachnospiraceae bacterium]
MEDIFPHQGKLIAYVDGSFHPDLQKYAFGCVLLTSEGEIVEKSGSGSNPESAAIRNVAGEMLGAMYAARYACVKGYRELEIRYDYEGIEKWVTGAWKAKKELTRKYAAYMRSRSQYISLSFTKVRAHSGNEYNDRADALAKAALLMPDGLPQV